MKNFLQKLLDPASWQQLPTKLVQLWRSSIQIRSVTLAALLSGVSVLLISIFMSTSISTSLFESRLQQALTENLRATDAAQQLLDSSSRSDEAALTQLIFQVKSRVELSAPGAAGKVGIFRSAGQSTSTVIQDIFDQSIGTGVISLELREKVSSQNQIQYYQSVTLPDTNSPGIAVGSSLDIQAAGKYELYTVFDLADSQATLDFIQQILFIGGLILVLLVTVVSWLVVRMTVSPIRNAALTSKKLAKGDLEVRIPVDGEDEIAVLARSFNNMANTLQEKINKLDTLSKLQQRFVSDVSHELRTPLTTIRLAGDLIYSGRQELPDSSRRAAELLHSQIQRFEALLNDLLEISRIDAGAVQLELEPTSVVQLVEEVVEFSKPLALSQGSEIELQAIGGYLEAEIDSRRISRIVRNLIDNAIEHGQGKKIVVTVDSNETAVALAVRDYGVGMSIAEQKSVFDRFWRADSSRKRTIGGTGLGLAISLEDTLLHHGWLDVWSAPGEGSYFRLTLPRTSDRTLLASPLPLPPEDAEQQSLDYAGAVTSAKSSTFSFAKTTKDKVKKKRGDE